jgi:uncharacterized protein (DUF58 family)
MPADSPAASAANLTVSFGRSAALAASLPPLLVAAHRVAATVIQGVHGRRRVGQGDAFWQFRQYRPGDTVNRIDWRQSAKSRAVYVRETEWEAAASVWLWRDASASMRYRSGRDGDTKAERAELLLLALASLLIDAGERIAMLGRPAPPTAGRGVLRRVAFALADEASIDPATVSGVPVRVPLPAYAHLVIIGDLLDPLDEIERVVRHYAGLGVRGHLLQVLDPAEEELPFAGHVKFAGLERDGDYTIRRVEAVRGAYAARLAAQKQGIDHIAAAAGWTSHRHRTDKPPQQALMALYLAMGDLGRWRGAIR